jgi:hypothetical protein
MTSVNTHLWELFEATHASLSGVFVGAAGCGHSSVVAACVLAEGATSTGVAFTFAAAFSRLRAFRARFRSLYGTIYRRLPIHHRTLPHPHKLRDDQVPTPFLGRGIEPPQHHLILPILPPRCIAPLSLLPPIPRIELLCGGFVREAALAQHTQARARGGRPPELFKVLQSEARVLYTCSFLIRLLLAGQGGGGGEDAGNINESGHTVCPCEITRVFIQPLFRFAFGEVHRGFWEDFCLKTEKDLDILWLVPLTRGIQWPKTLQCALVRPGVGLGG